MLSCGSNAGMEMPGPRAPGQWHLQQHSVPLPLTHQAEAASNDSHPVFLSGRLFAELCCRFCNLEVHAGDHDLLDYCTFGV